MPRTYSDKFLLKLYKTTGDDVPLGVKLARLCVEANIPMPCVAQHVGVTKLTVFYWFRGRGIRAIRVEPVKDLIAILQRDLKAGVLPTRNIATARAYFSNLR